MAAVDAAGNATDFVASDGVAVVMPPQSFATSLVLGGDWVVIAPSTLRLRATLSDADPGCDVSGQPVDFYVDGNLVAQATTTGGGDSAVAETSALSVDPRVGSVQAVFLGAGPCDASTDGSGAFVVSGDGDTTHGAGRYLLPGVDGPTGVVSFGFRTWLDAGATRGQVVAQEAGAWLLTGSIHGLTVKSKKYPANGQATGTGQLRCWDGQTDAWVTADTSVSFKLVFQDVGAAPLKPGQVKLDKMTVSSIGGYSPSSGCPAPVTPLVQAASQNLTDGGIAIKP